MNPCPCCIPRAIALIACLLLAGIPSLVAADGMNATSPAGGTIIVMSFPEGASVFLNGDYRGITPIKLENIYPGKYVVSISKAGASNDSVPVEIFEGSTREIGFTLEAPSPSPAVSGGSGSVAVDSSPGGASVILDGKPAGTTPAGRAALVLNDVPAGSHTITVELAGYPAYTSTVTVIKNQVVKVDAVLETQSPAIAGIPVATTVRQKPVPLPPFIAVAAAGLAGLAAVLRRS
jgi:PEGA domain